MRTKPLLLLTLILLLVPMHAWAKPKVAVSMTAEKEITVTENDQQVVKRVPAKTVESGQTIFYTLTVTNSGYDKATNVEIKNPLPAGTVYVGDTAFGEGTRMLFSVDGGRSFDIPARLAVEVKQKDGSLKKVRATPEQYTHIRWTIREILPGKDLNLGYQVTVK